MKPPLRIGVVCYPTYGGSGIIATEVGLGMAERGNDVHFICYDEPRRLRPHPRITFHGVEVRDYPVFHHPPYVLALASKIVEVATWYGLDVLHVHYAIPHAAAAVLARQVIASDGRVTPPRVITTLHGTDITVVGSDPSYLPVTRHGLRESQAVTVPSNWLRSETHARLDVPNLAIETIPNFIDTDRFQPDTSISIEDRLAKPLLVHVSNFRPVKRVRDVIDTFAAVRRIRTAELVMVGDGPDRSMAEARVRELGLQHDVRFVGRQDDFTSILQRAAAFMLPSETESFGVAALEAMGCGIPVIASRAGGLPEVVIHQETGFLHEIGDIPGFASAFLALVDDPKRWATMAAMARLRTTQLFGREAALDRYETLYRNQTAT